MAVGHHYIRQRRRDESGFRVQRAPFVVPAGKAGPATYALTVVNGSGSGTYAAGRVVTITANTPPAGQAFVNWSGATVANGNVDHNDHDACRGDDCHGQFRYCADLSADRRERQRQRYVCRRQSGYDHGQWAARPAGLLQLDWRGGGEPERRHDYRHDAHRSAATVTAHYVTVPTYVGAERFV
jgi:hypothetical protein